MMRRNRILAGLAASFLVVGTIVFLLSVQADEATDPASVELGAQERSDALPDADGEPLGDPARYVTQTVTDPVATPGDGDSPESPDTDPSADDPAADPASRASLRILWWNDTSARAPQGAQISIGESAWTPGEETSSRGLLADVSIDTTVTLVVLPDGPQGVRLEIPLYLAADMEPESDADAVHVEISDSSVRVLGNAVDNFDVTFDRF